MFAKDWHSWLTKFSASEGVRYFWSNARARIHTTPIFFDTVAENLVKRLCPVREQERLLEGSHDSYFHMARLALGFWDRLLAHRVTPAVAERVRNVSMASVPEHPPLFLRNTWLIEVCKPLEGERLFGDTTALAAYLDIKTGCWALIGWLLNEGRWQVRAMSSNRPWTAAGKPDLDDVGEGYLWSDDGWDASHRITKDEYYAHRDWYCAGVQFAMVFGALLEAENTFLQTRDERPKPERGAPSGKGAPRPPGWITRYVGIDRQAASGKTKKNPAPTTAPSPTTEGRSFVEVPVREHVRLQPHGPGNSLRKWLVIKAHMSHRWTSPNPKRIVVTG